MTAPDPRLEAAARAFCDVTAADNWADESHCADTCFYCLRDAARILAAADAVDPLRQLQTALGELAARQDRLGAEFEAAIYSDLDSLYEDGPLRRNDGGEG